MDVVIDSESDSAVRTYKEGDYVEIADSSRREGDGDSNSDVQQAKRRKVDEKSSPKKESKQKTHRIARIERIEKIARLNRPDKIRYYCRVFFSPADTFFKDGRFHNKSKGNIEDSTTCSLDNLTRIFDKNPKTGSLHKRSEFGCYAFHRRMLFLTEDFFRFFEESDILGLVNVKYIPRELAEPKDGEPSEEFNTYVNEEKSYWFWSVYNSKNHDVKDPSPQLLSDLNFTPIARNQPEIPKKLLTIDAFLGLGGIAEGFKPFLRVTHGIDVDKDTLLNAQINHPDTVTINLDVNDWLYIVLCKNDVKDKKQYINSEYQFIHDGSIPYLTMREYSGKRKIATIQEKVPEKQEIEDILSQRCIITQTQFLVKCKKNQEYTWELESCIDMTPEGLSKFWREDKDEQLSNQCIFEHKIIDKNLYVLVKHPTSREKIWVPLMAASISSIKLYDFGFNAPRPGDVLAVVGGSPCNDLSGGNHFSHLYNVNPFSSRNNKLVITFVHLVRYFKPRFVMFENVKNICVFAKGGLLRVLFRNLVAEGYQTSFRIMNSAFFGVPQLRSRTFVLASLTGLPVFSHPSPTHYYDLKSSRSMVRSFPHNVIYPSKLDKLPPAVTFWDIVSDLSDVGLSKKPTYAKGPINEYQARMRRFIKPSQDGVYYLPSQHMHRFLLTSNIDFGKAPQWTLKKEKGRLVPKYIENKTEERFSSKNEEGHFIPKRFNPNRPLVTIRAKHSNKAESAHPFSDRNLTVLEIARAQSIPDNYQFMTQDPRKIQVQIGNAVPPLMVELIVKKMVEAILQCDKEKVSNSIREDLQNKLKVYNSQVYTKISLPLDERGDE